MPPTPSASTPTTTVPDGIPVPAGASLSLTTEQLRAIHHSDGHARVVAVAGAGKTATLTHYLAGRLTRGCRADRLLVLMYNRTAQEAFQQRLQKLCPGRALPKVRTFHALGLRLYQRLIQLGWLPPTHLSPMSEGAVELQLRHLLQHHGGGRLEQGAELQEWLDLAKELLQRSKSDLRPVREVLLELNPQVEADFLPAVIQGFEQWRRDQRLITFDDMLYDPACLFQREPASRQPFCNQLDEILVDEYQDINPLQHFLLQLLAGERAQVMVIGDPDQTIYEFRGSSPDFITQTFARDFRDPVTYHLSHTFRFGHALALAANQLISHNRSREPLLTVSAPGTPNTRLRWATTDDHGGKIAEAIEQLRGRGAACQGMAVLCRLWSYARPVELHLLARGIPYRIEGEQSILQCQEIRPFWHCLELLAGRFLQRPPEQQHQALFDLLVTPSPKIPHALLHQIARTWTEYLLSHSLSDALQHALPASLNNFQRRNLQQLVDALRLLERDLPCARRLQLYANQLDYQKRLQESALNTTQGLEQAGTVTAFLRFLHHLPQQNAAELLAYLEQMQARQQQPTADAVTLTTIHRSKGLEWPAVFLPNLAEGHLPCLGPRERQQEARALESERRLLYVALTRAQKQLFITLPDTITEPGVGVSRFAAEMQLELSTQIGKAIDAGDTTLTMNNEPGPVVRTYLARLPHAPQLEMEALLPPVPTQWSMGDGVHHTVLGRGEIEALDSQRLHIRFSDGKVRIFARDLAAPHLTPMENSRL